MEIEPYCYDKLPFSKLFKTYLNDFDKLSAFYAHNPLSDTSVRERADILSSREVKSSLIQALESYHNLLGINQKEQLAKLSLPKAITIVTGQQLGIYGGPLYTIYKTMTAVILAKQWERKLKVPVVPVFWMADEDHDFEEVAWFGIPGNENFIKADYREHESGRPVSEYVLTADSLAPFDDEIWKELGTTDFTEELKTLYANCFSTGGTFASAFAKLIDAIFAQHGLLIAGSNFSNIKKITADTLVQSIAKNNEINDALKQKSDAISRNYRAQVTLGSTNLFYLDEQNRRIKIEYADSKWEIGKRKLDTAGLTSEIKEHPEKFSPNVFLRPILQDTILPTLGYVAGPGETAYYAQMKDLYAIFNLGMPVIFPRISATILESGIFRNMEKLPFNLEQYQSRIEDLISDYVQNADNHNVEAIFDNWKSQLNEISKTPAEIIKEIDGSLDGTTGKTITGFESAVDALKERVYRSLKMQEQTQINRIKRVKAQLFPDGGLQERSVSFMYFMNKYGIGIWDEILDAFSGGELDLSSHYLIKL